MDTSRPRALGRAVAAMLAAVLALGACTAESATNAVPQDQPVDIGGSPTAVATPSATPEERVRAALEQLVRDYYAAENAVFLDPSSDPSAALDPYLRNPASAARVADVLSFRNAGHTLESRSAVVHSVEVTALDLTGEPRSATVAVCKSLVAEGTDGLTGQPALVHDRGLILWTATEVVDRTWRLAEYVGVGGDKGQC